jgi:citrate lyase subunit beta/citryl-CoA lyase
MRKALAAGADAAVFDLEDAVAPGEKERARQEITELLGTLTVPPPCEIQVRINRDDDGAYNGDDVRAVVVPGVSALRLPKAEDVDAVREVVRVVDAAEAAAGIAPGTVRLYPIVESALGVLTVAEVARAHPRVDRFCFGSTDFLADIGSSSTDGHDATLVARSTIVLGSRAAGCAPPIDSVFTEIDDLDGLRAEATWSRGLGFFGKSVIHPRQISAVHDVFSPTEEVLAAARSIVEAFAAASADGEGAIVVDGHFVDAAVAARASALLRTTRAEETR